MPDSQETRDALASAIREMRDATEALRTLISKDYPTRREMERRFVQKANQRARVSVVVLTILAATVGSFFGAVTTVSTCFLGDIGDHPAACGLIPGFEDAEKRNRELINEFFELQKRTRENQERIKQLEEGP